MKHCSIICDIFELGSYLLISGFGNQTLGLRLRGFRGTTLVPNRRDKK